MVPFKLLGHNYSESLLRKQSKIAGRPATWISKPPKGCEERKALYDYSGVYLLKLSQLESEYHQQFDTLVLSKNVENAFKTIF